MKYSHRIILLAALILISPIPRAYAIEDAIIAVVNDELITLKDLKDYVSSVHTQLKLSGTYSEKEIQEIMKSAEKNAIDKLIEDRLVLNAANNYGIEVKRPAIDEKLKEVRSRYPSEEAFIEALTADGFTISQLRDHFENQLKTKFFIDSTIKSMIHINPQDVNDFYKNNPDKFKRPEGADVDSIYIPFSNDEKAAEQKADEAYELINSGSVFSTVAKQYSTTPSIGTIAKGQMKAEIEEKIFSLKEGETAAPFKIEKGVFIFKLKKHLPAETVPLKEANDQIVRFLFNEKFKEKMTAWLDEQKKQSYIEIKMP